MRWTAAGLCTLAFASLVACSESSLPTQPTPGSVNPSLVTFAGVISDSETNAPLAGVTVCFPHEPNCAQTRADGSYQFTVDLTTLGIRVRSKLSLCPFAFFDRYEGRSACVPLINGRVSWSTTLQRTITLDAGRSVRSTVFKGEGSGVVDSGLCEPCKSFTVLVPGSGTLFLSVVADSPESNLRIEVFYKGFENGALQITTQHSVQVIVHAALVPASFELVTSFTPES
ncbi:MAG TPA: hypothetical protein VLD67_00015 [Vicinamibacterales bacterium]|nr:hypothetical protein [Vicinamibacterales bacterium]